MEETIEATLEGIIENPDKKNKKWAKFKQTCSGLYWGHSSGGVYAPVRDFR